MSNQETKEIYTCPMHPKVQKGQPGLCPECGMNLVKATIKIQEDDHAEDKHAGHKRNDFLAKFWISLVLSIPVIAYSEIVTTLFNWQAPTFPGSRYIPFVLGTIVFFYPGLIFLKSAYRELKAKVPGMMTLIALAISVAYIYSTFVVFIGEGKTLFWELTTLIAVMLLGHYIEMKAVQGAQGALRELSKLIPDTAEVVQGEETKTIPLSELKVGDIIFIRPGARVAADGIIIEGTSKLDESLITGESRPIEKSVNDEVIGGTTNKNGALKVRVSKIGDDTFLSGVMRLVAEAQASKSNTQLLADKAAYYLTIIAISAGAITFGGWFFAGAGLAFAIERLVAVLVIACPHALGLAIPLVASISTTKAAKNGFLVKKRSALEEARKIDVVLFDKTGTLTQGAYGVDQIWTTANYNQDTVLQLAASVDAHSEHFISKAILTKAKEVNISLKKIENFGRIPGKGVGAQIENKKIYVGGEAILEYAQSTIPEDLKKTIQTEGKKGKTIIYVIEDGQLTGLLSLADLIREESKEAISALKKLGVQTAMITGDSDDVAVWVSQELGIDEYFARVLPGQKAEKVKALQDKGLKVAMVGDGINDAPALTQADLGVAIGRGTNVAIESAGIILVKNDPRDIVKILQLSKLTYRKMKQNLFWATGYNIIALPLAAGVLASQGILLQPAVAAIFMSFSTIIVAANAMLLKRNKLSI